jgi:tetratricopeptide (TPR) repeat protein
MRIRERMIHVAAAALVLAGRGAGAADRAGGAIAQGIDRASPADPEVLRRAAVEEPPREAAVAAWEWNRLRWQTAGGIDAREVAPLLGSFGDPATRGAWEAFIALHGAATIRLIAPMADTAGQQENVPRALAMLLGAVPARDLAAEIADMAAAGSRRQVKSLLVEVAGRIPDAAILGRICEVLLLLWGYEEVPGVAIRGWAASPDESFIRLAAAAVRRGGLESSIGTAVRRLMSGRDRAARGAELAFWVRLARETGAATSIRGSLRPADLERLTAAEADSIVGDWMAMGLGEDLESLLGGASSPVLLYLRSRVHGAAGRAEAAAADVEAAIERLAAGEGINQQAAFDLGEIMERREDAASADRVWTAIVERPPAGTVQDANALLRLARRAESAGDFPKALSLCEQALRISRELGAGTTVTGPGGGRGTEWLMRAILDLKRRASAAEIAPAP